ncbi:MAG TPA: OsmC family protein [Anaerolineae bacterium]|jgi:putative redox protein
MDAKVTWKHDLVFSGVASGTNYTIPIATHTEGVPSEGASPMELLLMGTAGCSALDVISILQKKRQAVTGLEVNVHAERASEHPRVFTQIDIEYVVTGKEIDAEAVKRAVDLSLAKYCSAYAMMSKAVPIDHTFRVVETQN